MIIFSVAVKKFLKDIENHAKITKGYVSNETLETYTRILRKFQNYLAKSKIESLDLEKVTIDEIISFLRVMCVRFLKKSFLHEATRIFLKSTGIVSVDNW